MELLDEVYASHCAEAEVSAVHLIIERPSKDEFIFAQPEKLYILFENLIYNALKAITGGGTICISAEIQETNVWFTVKDHGCGIPDKELSHIFNRFYVGEKNKATGSGLGLYIVKTILEELGGDIFAASTVGEGTTFSMRIPLAGDN